MLQHKLSPRSASRWNRIADVGILVGTTLLASTLTSNGGAVAGGRGVWAVAGTAIVAALLVAVWLLGARALRHYDLTRAHGVVADLVLTCLLVFVVGFAFLALRITGHVHSPSWHALWAWPALLGVRLLTFAFTASDPDKILIVGTGMLGRATGDDIRANPERYDLIGYARMPDDITEARLPAAILASSDGIEQCLADHQIDEVFIAGDRSRDADAMQTVIRACESFGIPFALPAYGFRFNRARPVNAEAFADGYVHYLCVAPKPMQLLAKRFFDIAASAFALAVLSPLLFAVAVIIRLTSRGPVLFKQKRVGLHGRTFHMLKFRSMVINAEELKARLMAFNEQTGPVFKLQNDPRITSVGRFIRKFSIDELPQLLNVLRGEMSIVGPRPPLPNEVEQYEPWQRRRLSVPPGLTCVWQVSGRNQISFEEWMYLDMQYIDHWSLKQDIRLILKTVPVVITGRGAS
jgi:exopolysaccharide biosynthesis polyprenyl glycosylphosphotransferase